MIPQILFLLFTLTNASTNSFSLKTKPDKIYLNDLNQLYFLDQNATILKTNLKGDSLYTFEQKSDEISKLDVTNPLRIIALSSTFNSLVFLDQTLTPINNPIQLDQLNIPFVETFASSRDNNFWVFNEIDQNIVKIDQNARIKSTSQKINLLLVNNIKPIQMRERNNHLYLLDPNVGLLQFDFLGTYKYLFKEIKGEKFEVIGNKVVFLNQNKIYVFDTILMELKKVKIPFEHIDDFCVNKSFLVINQEKQIHIMPFNF